jgi:hypothetical protein
MGQDSCYAPPAGLPVHLPRRVWDGPVRQEGQPFSPRRLVAGTLGGNLRKTYTVIGDTVNTAQRIEAMTKGTRFGLLVSRAVFDQLDEAARDALVPLGPTELPGKRLRIELFGVPEGSTVLARTVSPPTGTPGGEF